MRPRAGSPGAQSGRYENPILRRGTTWMRNWATPPRSVPTDQPRATAAGENPAVQRPRPHSTDTTLNMAGANAGKPKRSSAFSIPMATAAKDTRGRNGIMTRVSIAVNSALPATAA